MSIQSLGTTFIFCTAAGWTAVAPAQVETIDPNPTMPRDVGGRLTYRGPSSGGTRLGRATGREENPAETLLRSIDGSNYGRATGHSIFSRGQAQGAIGKEVVRYPRMPDRSALYYSQRGAYEDSVYHPTHGSYRSAARQQTYYQPRVRQSPRPAAPKATRKGDDDRHTTVRTRRRE